ncbi:hypothetical protein F5I97DRAFT_418050 [Phlebopus sp. FC_14]|nr:hypothetical protein F5I97DRAFT_418050 [Phlebopus sp. FC_14]
MVDDHEEQNMATMGDFDDVYQLILDMECDVKQSEATRVEINAKYAEERKRHLALEGALEAERQGSNALFQSCKYVLVRSVTERSLRNDLSAVRADVDALRADMDAMKRNTQAVHGLAEEKVMLQSRVESLERGLRRHELLAAEVRKIEVADIARLTSERDEARKAADEYARQLQIKNRSRSSPRATGLISLQERSTPDECEETTTPRGKSSGLKEVLSAYRSLAMALVDSLSLELDLVRERKAKIEKEKADVEKKNKWLQEKLREANRRRKDEHELYVRQLTEMKATIDEIESSETTLADISSQAVLPKRELPSAAWKFGRTHERIMTIKSSAAELERRCEPGHSVRSSSSTNEGLVDNGQQFTNLDVDLLVLVQPSVTSEDGWISSSEHSFSSSDFGGTSTPLPKSDVGGPQDVNMCECCDPALLGSALMRRGLRIDCRC